MVRQGSDITREDYSNTQILQLLSGVTYQLSQPPGRCMQYSSLKLLSLLPFLSTVSEVLFAREADPEDVLDSLPEVQRILYDKEVSEIFYEALEAIKKDSTEVLEVISEVPIEIERLSKRETEINESVVRRHE